ncbi:MAG: VWA domain-containing protein [Eubacterium sp.]|nr:VWA domain-containing protein [Eubacterium sp.]
MDRRICPKCRTPLGQGIEVCPKCAYIMRESTPGQRGGRNDRTVPVPSRNVPGGSGAGRGLPGKNGAEKRPPYPGTPGRNGTNSGRGAGKGIGPGTGRNAGKDAGRGTGKSAGKGAGQSAGKGASAGKGKKSKNSKKNFWLAVGLGSGAGVLVIILVLIFLLNTKAGRIQIKIDTGCLDYSQELDLNYLKEDFESFEGTVRGTVSKKSGIQYEIQDTYGVTVSHGTAKQDKKGHWIIEEPGMLMGPHTLTVVAANEDGKKFSDSITFIVTVDRFMEHATVDLTDLDEDGLAAYIEAQIGTDPENPDSDADGLQDGEEYILVGTDPTKYDTDGDSICDAERDPDEDSLTHRAELDNGTDPRIADTDGDGVLDGIEINQHKTDPLKADTDDDHASDGWEIEHGTDPLKKDESFHAKAESQEPDAIITATVEMDAKQNPEQIHIDKVEIPGLLDPSMVGYIGEAYDFDYDPSATGTTIQMNFPAGSVPDGDTLTIYAYDEDTQLLEPVPTTVTDTTATAKVDHPATYVLLDETVIKNAPKKDILSADDIKDITVRVAFVIDYSQSMDENDPNYVRLEIVNNYLSNLRSDKDEASIIKFAAYATTLVSMTSDIEMCINTASQIYNNSGDSCDNEAGTNGSDGLKHALDEFSGEGENQSIIFLTDGWDTTTSYDYDEIIKIAVEKHVVIYTISLGDANEDLLKQIASETGGEFFRASEITSDDEGSISLEDAFRKIQGDTIDFISDSNEDGISDYYATLIYEGVLRTGTGNNPFGGLTLEEILYGDADIDKDGLKNGEEVQVTEDGERIYIKVISSPILSDTDLDGYKDNADNRALKWDVGDRDMALFAIMAYEDGSKFVNKMFSSSDLNTRLKDVVDMGYTSFNVNSDDYGICNRWKIIAFQDVMVLPTEHFSCTIFECDDNIVIAYRGTNGEFMEWVDNILGYGVSGYHLEEAYASSVAKTVAEIFPYKKIYITGHSLGGYLSQIGAASMIADRGVTPEKVVYFDGMGMNFLDATGVMKSAIFGERFAVSAIAHTTYANALKKYAEKKGRLLLYRVRGDVVSALGSHLGETKELDPPEDFKKKIHDESLDLGVVVSFASTTVFWAVTGENVPYYYLKYGCENILAYFNITHRPDPFIKLITQGYRGS